MKTWRIIISILLVLGGTLVGTLVKTAPPIMAQSGCNLRINEMMYDPAAGLGVDARREWVELVVANDVAADTTYFMTDQDLPAAGVFEKVFVVPAGTMAGTYLVVHNDGNPANDGTVTTSGIYTTISFYMGNNSVKLNNGGDEVVLYQGSAVDGTPCDYVEYLVSNSGVPAGFNWNNGSCGNPSSSQPFGTSISLDPNGIASNNACDWAESGLNSPNDPGIPNTGGPDSQGYNNNTTPTAVSLASFSVTGAGGKTAVLPMTMLLMGSFTFWIWRKKE
ncbi:MAG: lamin tail domain-containing protein [Chloroflexi bacterium]|nr:lamin tail domain-containing protein [Chloroflexota bacterium]